MEDADLWDIASDPRQAVYTGDDAMDLAQPTIDIDTEKVVIEAYCCQEVEKLRKQAGDKMCIAETEFFKHMMSVEGLCLSRHLIGNTIRQDAKRKKYFAKILDNNLHRNLCYQVFFSMAVSSDDQYEKGDRFVIPSCVVNKIRVLFPSPDGIYTGLKLKKLKRARYFH